MMKDVEVEGFLKYLVSNGNLQRLATNFDNAKAPIHRWFPFLVGFSHNLVRETIKYFKAHIRDCLIFDPFIGSGTTAVVGKELGVNVIGNEVNKFLFDICNIKVSIDGEIRKSEVIDCGVKLIKKASMTWRFTDLSNEHEILSRCFSENNLKKLVTLRELIKSANMNNKIRGYLFIALTRSLNKSANVGINVPYISWSHKRVSQNAFDVFLENIQMIGDDIEYASKIMKNEVKIRVFLQDSRKRNARIKDGSVDIIFTSPPYLNNFDYGESLKVFLYFWKYAENWKEITEKFRKISVASATTYYNEKALATQDYEEILGKKFMNTVPEVAEEIISKAEQIRLQKRKRSCSRKKSFDLLTLLYFKDMFLVLKELLRVLDENALSFIVIGDSAPYGVHIRTDVLLGEMAIGMGFSSYTIQPLRKRGMKWRSLRFRHNLKLRESLLILRK